MRTVGPPATWGLEAKTSRDLEVGVTREVEEGGEIKGIKGIEDIERMGEVEEVRMGQIRRRKSGAQNGRMSIGLLPSFSPRLMIEVVIQLTDEHATTSKLQNDKE